MKPRTKAPGDRPVSPSNFKENLNIVFNIALNVKGSSIQPARQFKGNPTIMLAAPELSHRLTSGPAPLVGGSGEVLLKQRGPGAHVTVFESTSEQRRRTKGRSCLSWVGWGEGGGY